MKNEEWRFARNEELASFTIHHSPFFIHHSSLKKFAYAEVNPTYPLGTPPQKRLAVGRAYTCFRYFVGHLRPRHRLPARPQPAPWLRCRPHGRRLFRGIAARGSGLRCRGLGFCRADAYAGVYHAACAPTSGRGVGHSADRGGIPPFVLPRDGRCRSCPVICAANADIS